MRKWQSIGHAVRSRIRPEIISTRLIVRYIADRSDSQRVYVGKARGT